MKTFVFMVIGILIGSALGSIVTSLRLGNKYETDLAQAKKDIIAERTTNWHRFNQAKGLLEELGAQSLMVARIDLDELGDGKEEPSRESQIASTRYDVIGDRLAYAYDQLTPFEKDIFVRSVLTDVVLYGWEFDPTTNKQVMSRSHLMDFYTDNPAEELDEMFSMPVEHDYQSNWEIMYDGTAKRVEDDTLRDLMKKSLIDTDLQ